MRINLIKLGYEARQALARGPDVLANALVGRATVFLKSEWSLWVGLSL